MADNAKQLLDQYGKPVPREVIAQLRDEISAIGSVNARSPFAQDVAFGMTPERLGIVLRSAANGQSLEWQMLAGEIEELFTHYQSVLAKRRRALCEQPLTIVPASDQKPYTEHAELVQDWLETGVLQSALFDATDAIGRGYSVLEIVWDSAPGRVVPKQLLFREARHFEVSYEDGETLWLRSADGFVPLVPHKFVQHRHKNISAILPRAGLTRSVAFLWMYAMFTMKDWAIFCQAYGLPIRLGKYGPGASDNDKKVLRQAVFSIAGDVAAVIPTSMQMEFIESADRKAGTELYERRLDWFNAQASKLVLGSTAGTDAIGGSHAVGQEHRAAEKDVVRFDGGLLGNTLTRQVVQPMVAFSFGPQDKYPRLQIGQPDQVDLKDVIAGVADLAGLGLKVKASEVRERLGLSKPEKGDETIGGIPPAPIVPPVIPHPAVVPPEPQSSRPWLSSLIVQQSEMPPEIVERMSENLAADAAGALRGMTDQVRHCFESASDMRDLVHRVHALQLAPADFAEAMARGMALAELVGEASLVAELRVRK